MKIYATKHKSDRILGLREKLAVQQVAELKITVNFQMKSYETFFPV
jgi:hypothetical protein